MWTVRGCEGGLAATNGPLDRRRFVSGRGLLVGFLLVGVSAASGIVAAAPAEAAAACSSGYVALTFDDGPSSVHTPAVLDILAARKVPATFFVVGRLAENRPALVKRMAKEGHAVANHTYGHENLARLSDAGIVSTVDKTDRAVRRAGVTPLRLVRPPYGATSARVRAVLRGAGYTHILWDVDPRDWESSAAVIRSRVLSHLRDGAVILLHDGSSNAGQTRAALPGIIDGARSRGYCFGLLDGSGKVIRPSSAAPTSPSQPAAAARPAAVEGRTWALRSSLSAGRATTTFTYGRAGDVALMCDVNGNGRGSPAIVRGNTWYVKDTVGGGAADHTFVFGRAGDVPICGDWNGDGRDTPGVVRDGTWLLRDRLRGGAADRQVRFGRSGDVPVVGDWNGNGRVGIGVVRGSTWHLRDTVSGGAAQRSFTYGRASDLPVVGDWNGDGRTGVGIVRDGTWHLRDRASGGSAHRSFAFGPPGARPLTW
jgi:peptidoglycan/xylan/chitin deacetylase (PgdA/CDA1 family)